MRLAVKGRHLNKEVNQSIIRKACQFYCDKLFSLEEEKSICDGCFTRVRIEKGLLERTECCALMYYTDSHLNPRNFQIDLDASLQLVTTLRTLAHEFVHIRQLALSIRQVSLDGSHTRWYGTIVPNDTDYYDLPWEIDAHGREYGLYKRYVDSDKSLNVHEFDTLLCRL